MTKHTLLKLWVSEVGSSHKKIYKIAGDSFKIKYSFILITHYNISLQKKET